ncbi:ketoacyl-ACP synthase III [Patescibacteria group bacterium]|nr:ketoacyl-ACP synthase III [Patescibacteria group bacterium]
MMDAKISHIEYYLPETLVTNEDLAKENPEWKFNLIEPKTGVFSRHIAGIDERASDLAVAAAEKLFLNNNIDRNTIDALIFCTQSPDSPLPTTACIIQDRLKLRTSIAAFDFNLGCSGYVYGLAIAKAMIKGDLSQRVLLLCAETYSKYIAGDDRTSRPVFGDAGTATIIEQAHANESIGPFILGTDGRGKDKIIVPQSTNDSKPRFYLNGPGVFMFTMQMVPACVNELLTKTNKQISDVDLFVFHQASKIVIDNIVRILALDESKVFRNYEKIGNTVSASIPIALKQAIEQNILKKGDLVMLVGFGVGFSWGSCFIRW